MTDTTCCKQVNAWLVKGKLLVKALTSFETDFTVPKVGHSLYKELVLHQPSIDLLTASMTMLYGVRKRTSSLACYGVLRQCVKLIAVMLVNLNLTNLDLYHSWDSNAHAFTRRLFFWLFFWTVKQCHSSGQLSIHCTCLFAFSSCS